MPMRLYHGTTKEFDAFDKSKAKTSKHIYTTPDIRTASYYGSNIYELEIIGDPKVADLFDDHRLIEKLSDIFWEDFSDEALLDADIQTAIGFLVQTDPSIDDEWEAEEHPSIKAMIEREAKRLFAQTLSDGLSFGRVGTMGSMQDAILDELFGMGYDAVEIPDSSSVGSPVSIVWNDPSMIRPKKLLSREEIKAAPYYQMESYFDILARKVDEKYVPNNSYFLNYMKSGPDPYALWWEISEWISNNDYLEELGYDDVDELRDDGPEENWEKLPKQAQEEALEWAIDQKMSDDPADAPTSSHMSLNRDRLLPASTWLVHFTDDADSIARSGFIYGVPEHEMDRMGLTNWLTNRRSKGPGYNFAFKANDRHVDHNNYGREFVIFRSSGTDAYHYGDEQNQVVFWGPAVDPQTVIPVYDDDGDFVIRSRKTGREIRRFERASDAIKWVIKNYDQYSGHLTQK